MHVASVLHAFSPTVAVSANNNEYGRRIRRRYVARSICLSARTELRTSTTAETTRHCDMGGLAAGVVGGQAYSPFSRHAVKTMTNDD